MEWRYLFLDDILERGQAYADEGKVQAIHTLGSSILATVQGNSTYQVRIETTNEEFQLYCNCPHAEAGNYCKHMAATLFAWETAPDKAPFPFQSDRTTVEPVVDQASESEMRDYPLELFKSDTTRRHEFEISSTKTIRPQMITQYRQYIASLSTNIVDFDEFIEYADLNEFYDEQEMALSEKSFHELQSLLTGVIRPIFDFGHEAEAFVLTNDVWAAVAGKWVQADKVEKLYTQVVEIWERLYAKLDPEQTQAWFDWMLELVRSTRDQHTASFLYRHFEGASFFKPKLELAEVMESTEYDRGAMNNGFWALRLIEMLEAQAGSTERIESIYAKYSMVPSIIISYADYCIRSQQFDHAIERMSRAMYGSFSDGERRQFQRKLADVYRASGQETYYRQELWELVRNDPSGDINTWKELRELYSGQRWRQEAPKLLMQWPKEHRLKIYLEEGWYDLLLNAVLDSNFKVFNQYEPVLKSRYPNELLNYIKNQALELAENSLSRKVYRQFVDLLWRMQDYVGGDQFVQELVTTWRKQYHTQLVMLEELNIFNVSSESDED